MSALTILLHSVSGTLSQDAWQAIGAQVLVFVLCGVMGGAERRGKAV